MPKKKKKSKGDKDKKSKKKATTISERETVSFEQQILDNNRQLARSKSEIKIILIMKIVIEFF